MLKFHDTIKIKKISCAKSLAFVYSIPCQLNENIVQYLDKFGKSVYPIRIVKLLKIVSKDGYTIEGRMGKNSIKLTMPKSMEGTDLNKSRKNEFEKCLVKWIEKVLDMKINF